MGHAKHNFLCSNVRTVPPICLLSVNNVFTTEMFEWYSSECFIPYPNVHYHKNSFKSGWF